MLANPATIADLKTEWAGVDKMQRELSRMVGQCAPINHFFPAEVQGALYNFPVLLAFDVLCQTLLAARDEGRLSCRSTFLGRLMDDSKSSLSWIDWQTLRDGVRRRNEIAHDGRLFNSDQCLDDVQNVRLQLAAWSII